LSNQIFKIDYKNLIRAHMIILTMATDEALEAPLGVAVLESSADSVVVGSSVASVGSAVGSGVASVGLSVGESVGLSVGESVGLSVGESVGLSVGASLGLSVGESVGPSVGFSEGVSVGASVGATVGASVGATVDSSSLSWTSMTGEALKPEAKRATAKQLRARTIVKFFIL
jgi:hypothetical protein